MKDNFSFTKYHQNYSYKITCLRGRLLEIDFNKILDKLIKVIFLITKYQLNQNHVFTYPEMKSGLRGFRNSPS